VDGGVYEKSLGMKHFLVLRYPEEARLAPFLGFRSRSGWKG
jgi:hypothetical protein